MASTTSLVCYVGTPGKKDSTWHWGLNDDNSWYALEGSWIDGNTMFQLDGNITMDDLRKAARNSVKYYGPPEATLKALYASDSSLGQNHKILLHDRTPVTN